MFLIDQETYVKHYGVKGMRWGVRRDQRKLEKFQAKRQAIADANALKKQASQEKAKYKEEIAPVRKKQAKKAAIATTVVIGAAATAYLVQRHQSKPMRDLAKQARQRAQTSRMIRDASSISYTAQLADVQLGSSTSDYASQVRRILSK